MAAHAEVRRDPPGHRRDEVGEVRWGWNTPQWISAAQMDSFKVSGRLLNEIGPVKASTVTFLIPVFGVLWGAWLLDEPLSLAHLYGGLLIAVALWLVLRPARN